MAQTVLITGASSGIGAATAAHLAERGWQVHGTSRKPRTPSPDERGVHWVALDVCDDASVESGVRAVLAAAGPLDALVCNAGMGIFGSVEETPIEAARRQFETNYFGVLRTLQAVLPAMRAAGRGRVVLVGSLAARVPIPFQSHYSSTKAAISALAFSLHNELRGTGVQVALVEPGDIDTGFNDGTDWGAPSVAYAEASARCRRVIEASLPKAPGPAVVARAIERALTAARPPVRSAVGAEATLVPIGERLLPDRVLLDMIRRHFDL